MRSVLRASVLHFCIVAGSLAAGSLDAAAASGRWADLAHSVRDAAAEEALPGFALVVFDQGAAVLTESTWSDTTPLRWGSITKTFTALAALKLAEQGRLDLDAPVRDLLEDGLFVNPWRATHPLTTRQLLELTAGFADFGRDEWDDNTPAPLATALRRHERRVLWPPGLQHSYSNVPPGFTAAVVEVASGRSFAEYLRDAVLEPLGMPAASLEPVRGLPGGFAADGHTLLPYWHVPFAAFGALNAPVRELTRAVTMLLNGGVLDGERVFAEESIRAMTGPGSTPAAAAGLEVSYGAGVYGWVSHGHVFHGHGGDADGYRSRYGLLLDAQRGYLLVINADRPDALRRLVALAEAALVSDLAPTAPPPDPAEPAALEGYAGTYYPTAARFDVAAWANGDARRAEIRVTGGSLRFVRGGHRTALLPLGGGRFRRSGDPVATVVFFSGDDGTLYLQGELGSYVNVSHCPGFLPRCHQ